MFFLNYDKQFQLCVISTTCLSSSSHVMSLGVETCGVDVFDFLAWFICRPTVRGTFGVGVNPFWGFKVISPRMTYLVAAKACLIFFPLSSLSQ